MLRQQLPPQLIGRSSFRRRSLPLDHDFRASTCYRLAVTKHQLERAMARALAPAGITPRQVQVLACLVVHGPRSQVELADDLHLEPSTLVRILDRMARDGWVERRPAPEDRRKNLIHVTERVEPTWRTIAEHGRLIEARATRGLTDAELATLHRLLERVCQNLSG